MAKTLAKGHTATGCQSWDLKLLKPPESDLSILHPSVHPPSPLSLCVGAGADSVTWEPLKVHGHLRKPAIRTSGL